jgi:hypothetical protein
MPILTAAIIAVGALCLLDLLMTFGVIRRLREHSALLRDRQNRLADRPVITLSPGQIPAPFTAATTDGSALAGPAGLRLVGFFSSSCSACPERVPPFTDYVRANAIGRSEVLAVLLTHDRTTPPPYLDELAQVAQVSMQPDDSQVVDAFRVDGFPAFCLLDADGAVMASGFDPATLPVLSVA